MDEHSVTMILDLCRNIRDGAKERGFTDDQAFEMVKVMLANVVRGPRER